MLTFYGDFVLSVLILSTSVTMYVCMVVLSNEKTVHLEMTMCRSHKHLKTIYALFYVMVDIHTYCYLYGSVHCQTQTSNLFVVYKHACDGW